MLDSTRDTLLRAGMRIAPVRHNLLGHISDQAQGIIDVGQERHWPFKVLGWAPMIEQPVYTGDWWLVPAHLDTAVIPEPVKDRVNERVQAIYKEGIRPKGFVIAHEVPKLLASGSQDSKQPTPWWTRMLLQVTTRPLYLGIAALALAIIGPFVLQFLVNILLTALMIAGAALAIPAVILGLGAVSMVDPILVAVTEDNVWIEIDRWE